MKRVLFVVALALLLIGSRSLAADFNGDGTGDVAIFRESSGLWAIRGISRFYFGTTGDIPKPSDWEGNGTDLPAIFRDSNGLWALRGFSRVYFGSSSDKPKPGDYNGDGTEDIGIFRASSGLWAARGITRFYFGTSGDRAIAPDAAHGYLRSGGLLKTGQFTEYSSGDDGTYQAGLTFSYQTDDPAGNGDIVTIDNVIGLMWASDGSQEGGNWFEATDWYSAVDYCNNLDFAGFTDWRLPNLRELCSIVDYGRTNPALNSAYFPSTFGGNYWSSTSCNWYTDNAFAIYFGGGYDVYVGKNDDNHLRAVRGGL